MTTSNNNTAVNNTTNNNDTNTTTMISQWMVKGSVAANLDNREEGNVSLIQIDSSMASDAIAEMERFTGASEWLLNQEKRVELNDQQEEAVKKLFFLEMASRGEEKETFAENRKAILEANKEEEEELDRLIAEQAMDDIDEEENWASLLRKSQAQRGYEAVEWLKANAPAADIQRLFAWSKSINDRRFNPTFEEDRLSYTHWVAAKIVIELWISRKAYGKVKARAAQEFGKRRYEWEVNKLGERYDAHLFQEWDTTREVDMDASFMGRWGIPASRMAEFLDIARDKDEDLLKGFLLFREKDGLQLPKGKEAKSFANILIALSRCNGNKSAAAKLLGVASSTYYGWVKQAERRLKEMESPIAEAVIEGLVRGR